jgi:GNAT superfamily N-acetyltransferase
MNLRVQKAERSNIDSIAGFQVKMAMETENCVLDLNTVIKGVRYVFDNPYRGQYWLALDGDDVVASMLVQYEWSDWRNGDVLWVHSVYVLPDYRNKGVFTLMYKSLKELVLQSDHLFGIRLYVDKTNNKAQQVYQKLDMNDHHYDLYEWLK